MKRIIASILILLITSVTFAEQEIRKTDLAGSWYPSSSKKLTAMLEGYMKDAKLDDIPQGIIAIIAPHAGYIYSGPVAAYSFKAVSNLDIDTVIIIGFSHRRYFNAISVYDRGVFETPLGFLKIDEKLAKDLMTSHDKFYFNSEAFDNENSIEMELPYISYAFRNKDVKIVPIVIGVQSYENAKVLGDNLYEVLKDREKFLLIASTDMSHYHNYGEANAIDGIAIDTLKRLDPKEYFNKVSLKKCESCGTGAIVATMIAAKKLGADSIKILKYANSGDVTKQKDSVVGYLSAAMYKSGRIKPENEDIKENEMLLNETQKKRLLQIARDTMEMYVKTKAELNVKEDDAVLNKEMGAFVTIHKEGKLRGCIGNIVGKGPLYLTVRDMVIQSSTQDPRFAPVTESELGDIDIEVSVLSELEMVTNPNNIIMGTHGVIVRSGFRSGVYLPQVATETGWSREKFMSSLCASKAGLPADAWKKGEVDIYVFTAEVFGEKE